MRTGAPTSVLVKHTTMNGLKLHAGSDFDRETANTPDGGQRRGAASRRKDRGTGGQAGAAKRLKEAGPRGRDAPHPRGAGHCSQAAQRGGPYRRNVGGSGPPHREDSSRRHNSTVAPAREAGGSGDGSTVAPARDDISGTPPVTGDPVPTASSQSAPVAVRTTTASQTNPEDALPCRPPTGSPVVPSIEDVPPLTDGEGPQRQLTTTQTPGPGRRVAGLCHGPAVLPGALATKVSGAAATDPYSITGGEQEEGRGAGGLAGRQQQAAEGNRCAGC